MKTLSRQEKIKEPSKQIRYQLRKLKAGLCRSCTKPRVNSTFCEKHRLKANRLANKRAKNKAKLIHTTA